SFVMSLDSAVSVSLSLEPPPPALVLRSPFTSLTDMGHLHYAFLPVRPPLRERFDAIAQIPRLTCPVLVIAGDNDTIVPPEQSRRMFEAASGPKRFVLIPGADHNDFALLAGQQLMTEVSQFLNER